MRANCLLGMHTLIEFEYLELRTSRYSLIPALPMLPRNGRRAMYTQQAERQAVAIKYRSACMYVELKRE